MVDSSPYNYAQPVTVNVVEDDDAVATTANKPTAEDQAAAEAVKLFEAGLASFKAGDYDGSLDQFDAALKKLPGDPVIHEVRALALFATGSYTAAAAALNAFLATSPGMDWTTLSGLYGNIDDYTAQLKALQEHIEKHPNDAGAAFVMAYHYLVLGEKENAVDMLKAVVSIQPKDVVAKRMLDTLGAGPSSGSSPADDNPLADDAATTAADEPAGKQPETDLVGKWEATAGDAKIELTITEDFKFTWQATQPDAEPVKLSGELIIGSDGMVLKTEDQGDMPGKVVSKGPDVWQFDLQGAPTGDPGLTFTRVK